MNCTNHPDREANGMCAYCGKPFCQECLIEVKGRMYCKADIGNVIDEAKQTSGGGQPTINITNSNESTNTNTNVNANGVFGGFALKSRITALILCIIGIFGIAGLHRMYVGKVGSGIFYFCTCGFFFLGTIIDIISILSGGFRDSYGRPLR